MAEQLSGGREATAEALSREGEVLSLLKVRRCMTGSYHLCHACPVFHLPGKRILSLTVQEGK